MAYVLVFGLVLAGYTLIDWGHYRVKHEQVSMWYLVAGKGTRTPNANAAVKPTGNLAQTPQVFQA